MLMYCQSHLLLAITSSSLTLVLSDNLLIPIYPSLSHARMCTVLLPILPVLTLCYYTHLFTLVLYILSTTFYTN